MSNSTIKHTTHCVVSPHKQDSLTQLPEDILALNFERLKHKVTSTSGAEMSREELDAAEPEYRRFLALKVFYPGLSLVPSKQVAKLWHAHILDTRAYREDCEKVFGRFIDHYPYFGMYGKEDYQSLQILLAQTIELYERHFGPYPKASYTLANPCQNDVCREVTS
ncbi:MAG: hypothetical protein KAV87_63015 [Desulfobacteraceae bacterium]|nr:hypothetical protein [Desulfobacteraceae bacterium]